LWFRYSNFDTGISSFQEASTAEEKSSYSSKFQNLQVKKIRVKIPYDKSPCLSELEILCVGQASNIHVIDHALLGISPDKAFCLLSKRHSMLTYWARNSSAFLPHLTMVDRGQFLCFKSLREPNAPPPLIYIWYNPVLDFSTELLLLQ